MSNQGGADPAVIKLAIDKKYSEEASNPLLVAVGQIIQRYLSMPATCLSGAAHQLILLNFMRE